jgi:hypothetical protein
VGSEQAALSVAVDVILADLEPLITTIAYQFDHTETADVSWSPYETVLIFSPTTVTDTIAYDSLEEPLEVSGTYGIATDGLPTAHTTISVSDSITSQKITVSTARNDQE